MTTSNPSSQQAPGSLENQGATTGHSIQDAIISPAVKIIGDISGQGDIVVNGVVEGSVDFRENSVVVGEKGRVHANIIAKSIVIAGEVKGELRGSEQITLTPTGHVTGDIKAPRVVLNDGCQFKGQVDMESKPHSSGEPKMTHSNTKPKSLSTRPLSGSAAKMPPSREKR